ncbi:ABC transporter ATP-binding protein/permease [Gordonia sp. HY002]|uniref:ABC transporter transmembrane domain-containing protein n=1 Tax=Gordonia zhenghanii TaxID=2911516 RepID=UPI001EF0F1A8|nr:ABC transporter ATP-binding protein [Gordonia zhenghanii]MCF8571752.1 ABC transporter ATP-binding protein/permease [Gordonia zhenghanii]MCF8604923.1 ABC transporter ATP-binding protein/permease [Gordonia zhenghanii]
MLDGSRYPAHADPRSLRVRVFGRGFLAGSRPAERGSYVRVDEETTARTLVVRTMWGANKYSIPAMLLMIGHFAGEALVPVIMGVAIDRAVLTHDGGQLALWLIVLIADFALLSFTWRFGERMAIYALHVIEHQYRMRVTDRMLDPAGTDGPARLPGTALSIATSDVSRLALAVFLVIFPVGEMFAVVVAGVILLWISWPLGLAVLVGAPVMFWLLDRAGAPLRARTAEQQEFVGAAAGTAADLVAGFRVLKGLGADRPAARRYRHASRQARDSAIAAMRSEGVYVALLQTVSSLFVVAVGAAAGVMAVNGAMGLGALITVVGLTQFMIGPLNAISTNFGAVWNGAVPSADRVLSVLQAGPGSHSGDVDAADGPLVITGLPDPTGARSDLSIPPRGVTVISTDHATTRRLTAVLSRESSIDGVHIRIGDTHHASLDEAAGRQVVRVVPHTPHLFEGSVLENIEAVADSGGDRVSRAVFAAVCDDVAQVLPDGLDSPVGEAGRMLSGGQRQRVGLARALAAESAFLVLTDPTTAVDSMTEARVVERVQRMRADAATVVFTHSPSWAAVADTVIRLDPLAEPALEAVK